MSKNKETPKEKLYQAIREGNMPQVLEWVQQVNKNKKYPLHWGDESMKKFRNRWWNWLHYSVFFNQLEIVKHLVEVVKIDVNIQTILIVSRSKYYWDDTALHISAREGHVPIIKYLLTKAVKKDIKNYGGKKVNEVTEDERINTLVDTGECPEAGDNQSQDKRIDGIFISSPPLPTKENLTIHELEKRMKHQEEETKKMNLLIISQDRKIEGYERRCQILETKNKTFQSEMDAQKGKIEVLEIRNRKLQDEVDDIKKGGDIDSLRKDFYHHFEQFHQDKYSITKSSITPPMPKKEGSNIEYCYENDFFTYQCFFSIASGPKSLESDAPIDFKDLKVSLNGNSISQIRIERNMIEFDVKFTKMGRNEIVLLFKNIKKTIPIDVEACALCAEKCELSFYRGELEPSGDITRSDQPTDKFSSDDDIIQIVLSLVNENGVPLKYQHVKHLFFNGRISKEGARGVMRGVLSRTEIDVLEEDFDEEKGEFLVCSISGENEKKLEPGTYTVGVTDFEEVTKKKKLLISMS